MMNVQLDGSEQERFRGLYIDTGATISSLMSMSQYKAYHSEF